MDDLQDVAQLLSGGFDAGKRPRTDRCLQSTKIEQAIFDDLHADADGLAECEAAGKEKLQSFASLVNDVFQSIYTLKLRFTEEERLSAAARQFHKSILDSLLSDEKYAAIKGVCEGKELPALRATEEFSEQLLENLDSLMEQATGGKGKVDAAAKLQQDQAALFEQLRELMEKWEQMPADARTGIEKKIVRAANRIKAKEEQAAMFETLMANNLRMNKGEIRACVADAAEAALQKAQETQSALLAWGDGDAAMQKSVLNAEVLKRCAGSVKLRYIAQFLGRYKELLNSKRLAGYTYGRGQKYDITCGNSISRALTSDLALLSDAALLPLFIRKYQNKRIKQYRKREPEYKGKGDIIVCLDESGSTFGENNAYGMAIAMLLYEICKRNHTNFALVHFASHTKVDYFPKSEPADPAKVMACAETYLNGGTNFEKPLREVMALAAAGKLDKADIVFITDGICDVSASCLQEFGDFKAATGAKLTGILLDQGENFTFTLQQFSDQVYRTSELMQEQIVENLMDERV